jgi:hypothetical protein
MVSEMPDNETIALLHAHLWSLQAEAESQVRNLSRLHLELDHLPPIDDPQREADTVQLVADLEQVIDANRTIGALAETALEQARLLQSHAQSEGNGQARPRAPEKRAGHPYPRSGHRDTDR